MQIRIQPEYGGIYIIYNVINDCRYVGCTTNFKLRWNRHLNELASGVHVNYILQTDWDIYGPDAFVFKPLEIMYTDDPNLLKARERVWMDRLDAFGMLGYNIYRD